MEYLKMIWVVLQLLLLSALWRVFSIAVWRPYALKKWFARQGISGPSYSLLSGCREEIKWLKEKAREIVLDPDTHDIIPRVHPHYHKWLSQYGETFLYWIGTQPRIFICEPELVKQVLSKFDFYPKAKARPIIAAMLGKGLVYAEGLDWVKHRRAISPVFSLDKIKIMAERMAACTLSMINVWQERLNEAKGQCVEMEINIEFKHLAIDIIAHTAFGTSFMEGKEVFEVQMELLERAIAPSNISIPGAQYLPTRWNIETWMLNRRMGNSLKKIIEGRLKSKGEGGYGDDVLGVMLGLCFAQSSKKQEDGAPKLSMEEIMDECKTFFFAGHEGISNTLTWAWFHLSIDKEWQEKLREEVLRECGMGLPDADKLSRLKLVHMVLLEAVRLYPTVLVYSRTASKEMKLGDLTLPKGIEVSIPVAIIHRIKRIWGEDANEFNPMRFADGMKRAASHPNAMLSFSVGPRACLGQNFAMMEGKMVMALLLQRFSFSLSPNYTHLPVDRLSLHPENGITILLKPLNN